jgi:hypothetical protein
MLIQNKSTILSEILAKYDAIVDADGNVISTTKNTMVWVNSVVLAELINMLKSNMNYIGNQALPNLSLSTHTTLLRWCSIFKITLTGLEDDADLIILIYNRIQEPPAGGNQNDWIMWARTLTFTTTNAGGADPYIEYVGKVAAIEGLRQSGSIDIVVESLIDDDTPIYNDTLAYTAGNLE